MLVPVPCTHALHFATLRLLGRGPLPARSRLLWATNSPHVRALSWLLRRRLELLLSRSSTLPFGPP